MLWRNAIRESQAQIVTLVMFLIAKPAHISDSFAVPKKVFNESSCKPGGLDGLALRRPIEKREAIMSAMTTQTRFHYKL